MKKIIIVSVAALIFGGPLFAQDSQWVRGTHISPSQGPVEAALGETHEILPAWLKLWDEFDMDIPAERSLDKMLESNGRDFLAVNELLSDENYCHNPELDGRKTIRIYSLKRFASSQEVLDFIESQDGRLIDAQTLLLIWKIENDKINKGPWLIGFTNPRYAPKDLSQICIWDKEIFSPRHPANRRAKRFVFDVTGKTFGCPKNSYFAFITK